MISKSREIKGLNEIAFRADESSFRPGTWVAYSGGQLVGHSQSEEHLLKSLHNKRDIRETTMIARTAESNQIIEIPTVLEVE